MKLRQRVARLAARSPAEPPAECTGVICALVADGDVPEAGPATPTCGKCGGVHLLVIEEVVIDATGAEIG
jgi:hypothetical protein